MSLRCTACDFRGHLVIDKPGTGLAESGQTLKCPGCAGTSFLTHKPVSHPVELAPDTVFALANLPSTGPSGGRDNVARAVRALAYLLPPAGVSRLAITHDDECPTLDEGKGFEACTCDRVTLGLRGADVIVAQAEAEAEVAHRTLQGGNGGDPS